MNGSMKVPMNGSTDQSTNRSIKYSKPSSKSEYKFPTKGLLALLPQSWVPYAELIRLGKPVGILNVYFPYLYGSLFAAIVSNPMPSPLALASLNARLLAMAFLLRCAGCTWNDILDRDFDRQVARCRLRPVARGAISPRSGYAFFAAQISIWAAVVLVGAADDMEAWIYALVAVILAQIYPFAKRVTDYSQVVLGVTLSWGVLVGSVMQGIGPADLVVEQRMALACLYLTYIVWCVIHDTIYAFQDIRDDAKAGVKSMSLAYETNATLLLSLLAIAQVGLQVAMGVIIGAGASYYAGACVGVATWMCWMTWSVDVKEPQQCWWWFQYGCLIVGSAIAVGLGGEYLQRSHAVMSI